MNYSYISSVFPDFKKNQVYNDKVYNAVQASTAPVSPSTSNVPSAFSMNNSLAAFTDSLLAVSDKGKEQPPPEVPQSSLLEKYANADVKVAKEKDNLKFYNMPLPLPRSDNLEMFQAGESVRSESDCGSHVQHVLQCSKCRAMVSKQLSIENDKERNEEIMELLSYIMFGIFLLLLIDGLKKK